MCRQNLSALETFYSFNIGPQMGFEPTRGSDFFCVLLWLILYISLYFLYNININGKGWLVGGCFMGEIFLAINATA